MTDQELTAIKKRTDELSKSISDTTESMESIGKELDQAVLNMKAARSQPASGSNEEQAQKLDALTEDLKSVFIRFKTVNKSLAGFVFEKLEKQSQIFESFAEGLKKVVQPSLEQQQELNRLLLSVKECQLGMAAAKEDSEKFDQEISDMKAKRDQEMILADAEKIAEIRNLALSLAK